MCEALSTRHGWLACPQMKELLEKLLADNSDMKALNLTAKCASCNCTRCKMTGAQLNELAGWINTTTMERTESCTGKY